MAKLPRAPDPLRLAELDPTLIRWGPDQLMHRIYFKGGDHPTSWSQFRTFGPVSRFDHQRRDASGQPTAQDRGVLYAATNIPTALAEVFQRTRRVNRTRRQPWLASFRIARPLELLDLSGRFCVESGASAKLITGPYRHTQNWASGFYDAYPRIDGLFYLSSMTLQPNAVLFERCLDALPRAPAFNRALVDSAWHEALVAAARQIRYRII